MRRAALALALALSACAHVEVETGERIEVRTLGQVDVTATPTRVEVHGSGISSAFGRLVAALVSFVP